MFSTDYIIRVFWHGWNTSQRVHFENARIDFNWIHTDYSITKYQVVSGHGSPCLGVLFPDAADFARRFFISIQVTITLSECWDILKPFGNKYVLKHSCIMAVHKRMIYRNARHPRAAVIDLQVWEMIQLIGRHSNNRCYLQLFSRT